MHEKRLVVSLSCWLVHHLASRKCQTLKGKVLWIPCTIPTESRYCSNKWMMPSVRFVSVLLPHIISQQPQSSFTIMWVSGISIGMVQTTHQRYTTFPYFLLPKRYAASPSIIVQYYLDRPFFLLSPTVRTVDHPTKTSGQKGDSRQSRQTMNDK